jgi:hypothetical protein
MPKIDLRKQLKHLYNPPKNKFTVVDVPAMNFLLIDGEGDPNTSIEFQEAMEALYSMSYTLKFALKFGKYGGKKYDYPVMALEGLWWSDDMLDFTEGNKSNWKWTVMIMQPDFITRSMFNAARKEVKEKRNPAALSKVRFGKYKEGHRLCTSASSPMKAQRYCGCMSLSGKADTNCAASTTKFT